ncbi:MAG TPA: hypothetical protein PLB45_02315 [Bacilli bacterium]|jgi:hypothetical protein|nr:hypothetical protein [Bacilli bacterium]
MARVEKDDKLLDKRTLDKYRKEITEEFNDTYKDEIAKSLADDVRDSFNDSYKNQIKDDLTVEVKDEVKTRIQKEENKLSRHKSFKIFRLSIYLLVMIACILYVIYRLYITNNISVLKSDYTSTQDDQIISSLTTSTTVAHNLKWYINTYSYLLDNVSITNYSLYAGTSVFKGVDMSDKLSIAYKTLGTTSMSKDGIIYTIPGENLKNAYINLFGLNDYSPVNFKVDNITFAYSSSNDQYMAVVNNTDEDKIVYGITNITEDDTYLYVYTRVGSVRDNKLYSPLDTTSPICDYSASLSLSDLRSLPIITYSFLKGDKYYLYSLSSE